MIVRHCLVLLPALAAAWTFDADVLDCSGAPRTTFELPNASVATLAVRAGYQIGVTFRFYGDGCGTASIVGSYSASCSQLPFNPTGHVPGELDACPKSKDSKCASTCPLGALLDSNGCLVVANTATTASVKVVATLTTCTAPAAQDDDAPPSVTDVQEMGGSWKQEKVLLGVIIALGVAFLVLVRSLFFFHSRMRHARWALAGARRSPFPPGGHVIVVDGRPVSSLNDDDDDQDDDDDDHQDDDAGGSSSSRSATTASVLAEPLLDDDDCCCGCDDEAAIELVLPPAVRYPPATSESHEAVREALAV